MTNELADKQMLQKKYVAEKLTFSIKDTVDVVWMSQETIAEFFEVKRKEVIVHLATVIKDNQVDKQRHIRSISYVKNSLSSPISIQERQYSFTLICLVGFSISSNVAVQFRLWVILNYERFLKWGFNLNAPRVNSSEKRKTQLSRLLKKVDN
jgi:hypothetical protein